MQDIEVAHVDPCPVQGRRAHRRFDELGGRGQGTWRTVVRSAGGTSLLKGKSSAKGGAGECESGTYLWAREVT